MPRQRSRSPLSPILATAWATVRLFFILSVLLCSVNKAGLKTETWLLYCLRLRSRSPHNAKHSTSYVLFVNLCINNARHHICANSGERERAPSCGLNGRAVTIYMSRYIYIYIRPTRPALRMRGATRKRSRPDRESSQSS